jgi:hypothetical protein
MGRREDMKKAVEAGRASKGKPPPKPAKVAAAATPAAKKPNPRSAAARDARAKARGRLPVNTVVAGEWRGDQYYGTFTLYCPRATRLKVFSHYADGLFRLMEEMDVMFWDWMAHPEIDPAIKAELKWSEKDVKPEPYPKEKP